MAIQRKFEIGDTVYLNSGGPIMTVRDVDVYTSADAVVCIWFHEFKLHKDEFFTATLTKST
jgi:uncharacterized protein YodC (DUF2158 family)